MLSSKALVEGIIFAATHPVSLKTVAEVLSLPLEEVQTIVAELKVQYETDEHGMLLAEIGGGFQFRTKVDLKDTMAKFYEKKPPRLSGPMLEVMSVIAYKQPVTRPEIEKIRGVDCTAVLKGLLDKGLIEMTGRSTLPGSPTIYGTTAKFLEWFQIASLEHLPPLSEVQALNKEALEGSEHLLDLLNRDEGFVAESIQEMDDTLQGMGRLKSIEQLEEAAFGKPEEATTEDTLEAAPAAKPSLSNSDEPTTSAEV